MLGVTEATTKKTESDYKTPKSIENSIVNMKCSRSEMKQKSSSKGSNDEYKFLKSKKNTYILNHIRKPHYRIKHHPTKPQKRKSFISTNDKEKNLNDYSFDFEEKGGKSE